MGLLDSMKEKLARMVRRVPEEVMRREETRRKLIAIGSYREPAKVDIAKEDMESLGIQYAIMLKTLQRYKISLDCVPDWETIRKNLTPEVLEKARKLDEPALLLIPPVSRQAMVEAVNVHKASEEYDTNVWDIERDDLWNGGKPEGKKLAWEVSIVTGLQEVEEGKTIKGDDYQRAKAWIEHYNDQGVDVINDARTYLTLMIRNLDIGKPVDKQNWTILNAKNFSENSPLAFGFLLKNDRIALRYVYPRGKNIRVRGAVRVI